MPYISGGAVSPASLPAASVAISKIADPTTGKVIGSAANAAAAVFPPGFEIGYAQGTSTVNIASTTEATGTAIINPGALTFDGTAVLCEFFTAGLGSDTAATGDLTVVSLFEGATQITRLAVVSAPSTTVNQFVTVTAHYRFTPTAASHTYNITAFSTSVTGTPRVIAGAGGTATYPPMFVRFTKV